MKNPYRGWGCGPAKLFCVMAFVLVAVFNLTAVSAALDPLLGLVTLLTALLVTIAVLDRLGEQWTPRAMHQFDSWRRATVRHIRAE